ncbi:hypothetical protein [Streptomyces atratus]|uniref:hypothetical protein n=1 Tax=Streptomyces atratus TaxID=1893 RepID=UPI00224D35B4|nr:hypothetical protein [Streptomyces atratus]MCX5338619.1 hypothetical protein [Streptomyces atratus]
MSKDELDSEPQHRHIPNLADWLARHHEQVESQREEAELAGAIGAAAFDLGSDIGHPTATDGQVGYDVDRDLGIE